MSFENPHRRQHRHTVIHIKSTKTELAALREKHLPESVNHKNVLGRSLYRLRGEHLLSDLAVSHSVCAYQIICLSPLGVPVVRGDVGHDY